MAGVVNKVDVEVETELLAAIVQNRPVPMDLLRHLEPEYFSVESYKWLTKRLRSSLWVPFPVGMLDHELLQVQDEESRERFRTQLSTLFSRTVSFEKEAVQAFRNFVCNQFLNSQIGAAFSGHARTGRLDLLLQQLEESVSTSKKIAIGDTLSPIDLANDYDDRQERRRRERDNPELSPRILTGVPGLDEQFIIRAPMLVDFLAPFKRYKSIFLNAFGYAALLQGYNVLHLTYENSYELTTNRYDSMFMGLGYDRVSNLLITKEEKEAMDRTWEWIKSWKNRMKIIKCKSQQTPVSEVSEHIKRLQESEGFTPDVEIWDYLNLIEPSKHYREERQDQKQIVWDLKTHAEDFKVAVFSASQSNMEGAVAERLQLHHRGKSIDISQGIDLSIAIDQTEEERAEGLIVLSPMFARNADITIPEIVLDSDIPRMQIDPCFYRLWENARKLNPFKS